MQDEQKRPTKNAEDLERFMGEEAKLSPSEWFNLHMNVPIDRDIDPAHEHQHPTDAVTS